MSSKYFEARVALVSGRLSREAQRVSAAKEMTPVDWRRRTSDSMSKFRPPEES